MISHPCGQVCLTLQYDSHRILLQLVKPTQQMLEQVKHYWKTSHHHWTHCICGQGVLLTTIFTPQPLRLDGYCHCLGGRAGSVWYLVKVITLYRFPVSCNFYRNGLYIRILDEFDIDLCVTFLNFQTSSRSSCPVNAITLQQLHASCCNFTEIFSTTKSQTRFCLTFFTF